MVGYEKAVAAIDPEAATVGDDIAAVKADEERPGGKFHRNADQRYERNG